MARSSPRMAAWSRTVLANTAGGYHAFLADYPDSDLTPTARKLEERLRNRPDNPAVAVAAVTAGPTCPCSAPSQEPKKKAAANPGDLTPLNRRQRKNKPSRPGVGRRLHASVIAKRTMFMSTTCRLRAATYRCRCPQSASSVVVAEEGSDADRAGTAVLPGVEP